MAGAWLASCFSLSLSALVWLLTRHQPPPPELGGLRGERRQRARRRVAFRSLDWVLRSLARVGLGRQSPFVDRVDDRLRQAGDPWGLGPWEFLALVPLCGVFSAALAWWSGGIENPGAVLSIAVLGAALPLYLLERSRRQRLIEIERSLPGAVDVAALCMGAGLDFPGAIRKVVETRAGGGAVRVELQEMLRSLELGHTRERALRRFEERAPCEAVSEMVAAVIQSERQGTPLIDVLSAQARRLRERRSVLAEEAAAKAGVMLLIPMFMVMASVALLLVAPLFIQLMGSRGLH